MAILFPNFAVFPSPLPINLGTVPRAIIIVVPPDHRIALKPRKNTAILRRKNHEQFCSEPKIGSFNG